MKILRKGARADHGVRSVELKTPSMRWNPTHDTFDLSFATAAKDFATDARHRYHLRIEPREMASMLNQVSEHAASMDADDFQEIFGGVLPALLRLQLLASGVKLAA